MFAYLFIFWITSFEMFVPFVATLKTDYVIFSMTIMSSKQSDMQKTKSLFMLTASPLYFQSYLKEDKSN